MAKKQKQTKSPETFFNRELSWLEFNDRVLREGLCKDLPLLERMKFLAIVSSNLDEFFMIRAAGLMQQRAAGVLRRDPAGMTPSQQLTAVSRRVHRMVEEQTAAIREAIAELATHGIHVLGRKDWTDEQEKSLSARFDREILPVLTPLAVQELNPCPLLPGLQLHVALLLKPKKTDEDEKIAVVPVPTLFPRLMQIHQEGGLWLAKLEDLIAAYSGSLFPGHKVLATAVFRVTRDADIAIQDDDEVVDLADAIEEAVSQRRRRGAVRLEISAKPNGKLLAWLEANLEVHKEEIYEIDGLLNPIALWELVNRSGNDDLKAKDWPAHPPADLLGSDDLWQTLQDRDVLLLHPYESFDPVVQLIQQAAEDPSVVAIKQTLYRTSGDSPIVRALERAGQNGKEVTVLVELRARFDESRNILWARRLEDAGCHVVYGVAGLKTHAKALMIVRRESAALRRYVHLSTGNYNDRTARLYSDVGLMTTNRDIAADVAAMFNLTVEPMRLKQRFIDLIDREVQVSTPEQPGLIMAKVNSLQDIDICQALYRASQGGVRVMLNIRGICVLRPGVPGTSENIEVTSIIDRYLEHARVFYFRNGGHEEVYLSSADWMRRNLEKRVEIIFPIVDPGLRRRLHSILRTYFDDNVKARRLLPDGTYQPVPAGEPLVRAQETLHRQTVQASRAAERHELRFQPLTAPKE
jgi:polyphosphate kinase